MWKLSLTRNSSNGNGRYKIEQKASFNHRDGLDCATPIAVSLFLDRQRESIQSVNSTRTTYFGNKVKWLLVLWKLYDCYYLTWLTIDWQQFNDGRESEKSKWRHNMANLRDATRRICDVTTWRISDITWQICDVTNDKLPWRHATKLPSSADRKHLRFVLRRQVFSTK